MKKLSYLIGSMVFASILSWWGIQTYKFLLPESQAVSIPTTFSDGNVLTAAQLNSNNTTIYNAFNGHDHDGSDGEPSTLSPGAIDSVVNFSGSISSTLQVDDKVTIGDGTQTTATELLSINVNTGDPLLELCANNDTNCWDMRLDNDASDNFDWRYDGSTLARINTNGGFVAVDGVDSDNNTSFIGWKVYTGTTCSYSTATCTTDVDSNFVESDNAPYSISCGFDAGTEWHYVSSSVLQVEASGFIGESTFTCEEVFYDESADDISIRLNGSNECTSGRFSALPYRCIVMYEPA